MATPPIPPRHEPVMLDEIVAMLAPVLVERGPAGPPILVDCTLGLGGHAEALLRACPEAHLIGLDRDPAALALAAERLAPYADRTTFVEAVYDELAEVLARLGHPRVQGVLLDLGLSSLQIDDTSRGFAYAVDAPLDMRMDGHQELTAADVLNTYSARELTRIVAVREDQPFDTSARLVQVLDQSIPAAVRKTGGHPAKRTFQALRIEVNQELVALESVLPQAVAALALGGRIAVLAYHSLEDRLVKQVLAAGARETAPPGLPVVPEEYQPRLKLLTRGADKPTDAEIAVNRRAASARFRAAERIREPHGRRVVA
jgi:16S rRNA (cytosine1402-N4)-methyltransferase